MGNDNVVNHAHTPSHSLTLARVLDDELVALVLSASGRHSCDSMFFEDSAGALEQSARLLVAVVSYLVPNWATIYVFYVLPRFQFSTALDVSDLVMDDDDDDDANVAYELLLNEQELEVVAGRR